MLMPSGGESERMEIELFSVPLTLVLSTAVPSESDKTV